ncbi:efflux RND transporter permease subunit [Rheinheimera texasensis]|uniref:efflux RND transporter permease subunit n=1 Tax=Rheinheimera texasensis TaxID=306205 RepID=UPI0004E1DB3F|nr:MMPL family transporter [Rheinheimera texasensis]
MNHPWLDNSVKRPWLAVFLVLLVTVLFSWGAKNLYFRGDFRIFFSADNPQMQAFERMQAQFNKSDNMLVAVLPAEGDVFTPEVLTVVKKLTDAAWQTPYSLRVDSITNFQHTEAQEDDLLVEDLLLDVADISAEKISKIKEVVLNEPALLKRLVSADGGMTAVNITVQLPEKDQNKEVADVYSSVAALTEQLAKEHPTVSFKLAGVIALNNAFTAEAQHDASALVPLMFVTIIVLLALMLRSALAALAVVIIIILTISSTLGLAGWAGIFLSTATVNVPTLVMTLAVADSVHLIASCQFLMRQGQSKPDAIRQAMLINTMPVFITSATTAVGFLTLNFSEVPILRDFGNMVAVGVMLAWLLTILLLPALLALLPISAGHDSKAFGGMDRLAEFVIRRPGPILIGTVLLTLAGGYLTLQNRVNDEAVKYFSTQTEYRQAVDLLEEKLGGVSLMDFAIESGGESGVNDPAFIAAIDAFGDYLQTLPEVTHVSRISDTYKRLNKSMHGDDPAFYRLPESQELAAQYLLMYEMSLPFGLDLSNQLDMDKSATKVGITMQNLGSKEMTAIEDKTIAWFRQQYPQYSIEASSTALMFAHIGERNMASMMQSLPLAAVLISALLVLSLRSWKLGTISLLPNMIPALLGFGVWQLLSGEINLGLSVVASMSLGIIVDDTVHFLAKYQHARQDGRNAEDAVRYAFHSVGWALVVTTVVLVIGFSVLLLSDFRLNSDMGLLTGIILLIALIVDFLFLPAVLLKLDRKAYSPAPAATHPNGV